MAASDTVHKASSAFDLVVIASSLGGVRALSAVLANVPDDFPATILVAQHLSEQVPSRLVEVLDRRSRLPVRWMTGGQMLGEGGVLVAPPGRHAFVRPDGTLALSRTGPINWVRPSADVLLQSAADHYGDRLLAVILTGAGRDGASGAAAVKRAGGRVLAQSLRTCTAPSMPASAIRDRSVDLVLSLAIIAPALVSLVMVPGAADLLRVYPGVAEQQPNGMRGEDWAGAPSARHVRWSLSSPI